MKTQRVLLTIVLLLLSINAASAGDWPQWRYDAARSARSPDELPGELWLQWERQLPQPRPAWPASQPALRFDTSYEPVAAEGLLFVPSMVTDSVTAYDTQTGRQVWQFITNGPVRFAPSYGGGRLYFGSDDGYLYCVDAANGNLQWKVRGGPADRNVLGNDRLISSWPVRGGPVLHEGKVYFTAGIWPFMGIFVRAVDAESGSSVWVNSGDSIAYQINPHDSPAFGGLVPRGHLAISATGLLAPGGRTPPGTYDLETGRLIDFDFAKKGRRSVHRAVPIQTGSRVFTPGAGQVTTNGWEGRIEGDVWSLLAADEKLFVVTVGGKIYCFGKGKGEPIVHPAPGGPPEPAADQHASQGSGEDVPSRSVARSGDRPQRGVHPAPGGPPEPASNKWPAFADSIVHQTGITDGYALVLGLGTGSLAESLIRVSDLHLIAIDPDQKKIDAFRQKMIDAGWYGTRVAAHAGDPAACRLPPYMADLIVSEDLRAARGDHGPAFMAAAYRSLRPYGGRALLPLEARQLESSAREANLVNAQVKAASAGWSTLRRMGPLPGAADWTHNYADAANSVVSQDERVKAPLGILWFGGPSNDDVLPRHGHGPAPQVAAGRLFIEGPDMLRATDIYTGRLLWQRQLPSLGEFYNVTGHQPGAGEIGSNYVSLEDAVYVLRGDKILELDPATGQTKREIVLAPTGQDVAGHWSSIHVCQDLLIATATPVKIDGRVDQQDRGTAQPPPPAGYKLLIGPDDSWRYLAGTDPRDEWTGPDFDDRNWKTGRAGFGYGDGDDRTIIDMRGRFTRVFLRHSFDFQEVKNAAPAKLRIKYDDGFIAYLNGREIARASIVSGRGKDASCGNHEAKDYETFELKDFAVRLRTGKNVLAIEGHNASITSSDFSLDPRVWIEGANGVAKPKVTPKPKPATSELAPLLTPARYSSASRKLRAIDRATGRIAWDRTAKYGFRHNNIAVGGGRVYCIDGLSPVKLAALQRRGMREENYKPQLLAVDVRTGDLVWSTSENVFGTFLNYSTQHDVVLQAGSSASDRAKDEVGTGMVAYCGEDGQVIWQDLSRSHTGPCMLHDDTIITQRKAYSLLNGQPRMRKHPLTGVEIPWRFTRNYGCNTAVAGRNLILFRSAAAGFFDLLNDGGTGNLGGFRSSCTSNLIAAGGLLNAPDYTRTCTCNYQNQSSLAMVHDPQTEMWTFNDIPWEGEPVRQVGINFGAPGDRRGDDGILWLDYPSVGGRSPDLPVDVKPDGVTYLRHHSSLIAADGGRDAPGWVAASAVVGAREISIRLSREQESQPRRYRVRLCFAELAGAEPGERVFDVFVQGSRAMEKLDIARQAGAMTTLVHEVTDVEVTDELTIRLVPRNEARNPKPIISGIEIVAQ